MLRVACFAALAASASALVAPPARGAAALSSRLAPLEVQKGSIVRIMRPESCAAASETLRSALRRSGFPRRASFRRRARQRWKWPRRRLRGRSDACAPARGPIGGRRRLVVRERMLA